MDADTLMRRISRISPVGRAFGPVYEKGDILVVPVAFVAGGGGLGHGESGDQASPNTPATGIGGGSGGISLPYGVYEIRGDRVRFVPAFDLTRLVLAVLGLAKFIAGMRAKKAQRAAKKAEAA